ncbi:zinc finger protein 569-like [Folsomia candida]|uniref:zinc finger protein 569-like n=1 Tax=Folsomia candida TaxID=158441 RepID=UPI00160507A2|nr:zinc finger protein 569-like [Folsomia candida]
MDSSSHTNLACPHCGKSFKKKRYLDKHIHTHEPDVVFKCGICAKTLKNPSSLSRHNYRKHNKQVCTICSREFSGPENLKVHMSRVHTTGVRQRYPCPQCDKSFLGKYAVGRHAKVEHAQSPVRFRCTLCGREFKEKQNRNRHIATHTRERTFRCEVCGHSYVDEATLKIHKRIHDDKSSRESFKFKYCPQRFFEFSGVRYHERTYHENRRDYQCTICNKKLVTAYSLKYHVEAKHPTNEMPIYSCDQCGYTNRVKKSLARHVARVHVGLRTNECYFCGKKFFSFSDLVGHSGRMHTLEK